ncbi:MAG: putative L-aspartate dehydrogenase [Betaproteobacteria bacterium]|nr:putative L-aspartate dehydrogenase [Betaproteobacteria bacterium]
MATAFMRTCTVALIGSGAIACVMARSLLEQHPQVRLVGALDQNVARARQRMDARIPLTASLDELLGWGPELVVECAGHAALAEHGAAVLTRGVDLLVASVGALARPELESALRAAALTGGTHIRIPSGAIGGLDALASARVGGLDSVRYVGRKPVNAWRGTPAEKVIDLDTVTTATVIFEGSARDAALTYPQNANVTAATALAGIGFDATHVTLYADPAARGNEHQIDAEGRFGSFRFSVINVPLPENPKTSSLAAYSLLRCVLAPAETIQI